MKKLFGAFAVAVMLMGCSTNGDSVICDNDKAQLMLTGSIEGDATRVAVAGEKFNEVSWEVADCVRVSSLAGVDAELSATEAGKSDVRFVGEGVAATQLDTYYAIYPSTEFSGTVVSFDFAEQSGDDVAVLAGCAKDVASNEIDMTFKPVNALLHVSVSGASSLAKAEFMSYDGSAIASGMTYDFADDTTSCVGSVAALTVVNPAAEGFFFALPANLDMANGYVVRLTDTSGATCAVAYAAHTFERGKTSRVSITWSTPSVTLGAKTSYSYYLAGDSESANKCANNAIYFTTGINGESCASKYANVQNAMISDLGYDIEGTIYSYSNGHVDWNKSDKSFALNTAANHSTSWGEKSSIRAFIVVDGVTYFSNNSVWLTGLPYDYNFAGAGSLDQIKSDGWSINGSVSYDNDSLGNEKTLRLYYYRSWDGASSGYAVSSKFCMPNNIDIQASMVRSLYTTKGSGSKDGYVGAVANTTSSSTALSFATSAYSTSQTKIGIDEWSSAFVISTSNPYVSLSCDTSKISISVGTYFFVHDIHFRYAQ